MISAVDGDAVPVSTEGLLRRCWEGDGAADAGLRRRVGNSISWWRWR